ncbi:MAG: threonyl-tRNA synthetase editing domain-containing protein [Promethearchaeota archaeon]
MSFHVDYFEYEVTKKGRSKILEEITDANRQGRAENALVLFSNFEKQDEGKPDIVAKVVATVDGVAAQLKVQNLVLVPFAHLFGELSSLGYARDALVELEGKLAESGYSVVRLPFGWFNQIEMRAKGHPLSRISRRVD